MTFREVHRVDKFLGVSYFTCCETFWGHRASSTKNQEPQRIGIRVGVRAGETELNPRDQAKPNQRTKPKQQIPEGQQVLEGDGVRVRVRTEESKLNPRN